MSESNLVVLPDMQAVENTEVEEVKVQEGVVSAASKKLDEEEKAFVGSGRAKMIFPHVVKTLRGFIEEDDRFADVFANTARTISECCAAVVDKSGDVIIVPADLFDIVKDSTFLGHCVANTNRYYERISSEESYIVFLRYTDKPSRPWYTLEIEPGGTIRQKRSYSNEQYSDLQEAVPFLKEWQQVVQKRMDEKERKLAVESKEKRNKEFEELTVSGNIIHTGRYAGKLLVDELMKDLMEAAATA